jgi:hypothetical protein
MPGGQSEAYVGTRRRSFTAQYREIHFSLESAWPSPSCQYDPDTEAGLNKRVFVTGRRTCDNQGKMPRMLDPFHLLTSRGCRLDEPKPKQTIEYLREENRVLSAQLGDRRLRFNDDHRRRLASKAKGLGRKLLAEVATDPTQVRRARKARTRTPSHGQRNRDFGCSSGRGEPCSNPSFMPDFANKPNLVYRCQTNVGG